MPIRSVPTRGSSSSAPSLTCEGLWRNLTAQTSTAGRSAWLRTSLAVAARTLEAVLDPEAAAAHAAGAAGAATLEANQGPIPVGTAPVPDPTKSPVPARAGSPAPSLPPASPALANLAPAPTNPAAGRPAASPAPAPTPAIPAPRAPPR